MSKKPVEFSIDRASTMEPEPQQVTTRRPTAVPAITDAHLRRAESELTEPMVVVSFRMRESLRRRLRARSVDTGVSVQDTLTVLIERYLDQPLSGR